MSIVLVLHDSHCCRQTPTHVPHGLNISLQHSFAACCLLSMAYEVKFVHIPAVCIFDSDWCCKTRGCTDWNLCVNRDIYERRHEQAAASKSLHIHALSEPGQLRSLIVGIGSTALAFSKCGENAVRHLTSLRNIMFLSVTNRYHLIELWI